MTIEEFIAARLDERETAARTTVEIAEKYTAEDYSREYEWVSFLVSPHDGRQGSYTFEPGAPSPKDVLRQCVALRAILIEHRDTDPCDAHDGVTMESMPCSTLLNLAAMWSDHPDYQQDWAI